MSNDHNGSAFPYFHNYPHGDIEVSDGISRREWFATWAPEPNEDQIKAEVERDRVANPHGDSYKPPRRSILEIKADLRYAYADAMIARGRV